MSKVFFLVSILIVIFAAILILFSLQNKQKETNRAANTQNRVGFGPIGFMRQMGENTPEQRGKSLSNGNCQGMGKGKLGTLPMKYEDFAMIIPYGLMVGDHVTPIDHQYFSPTVFRSPRDTYEVYAMADSHLIEIQPRVKPEYTEYRMVFSISCSLFYYYDLVTSLAPDIKKAYESTASGSPFKKSLNIAVKEGQVIGRIGGQTLDFAVWDTEKTLSGFANPNSYLEERWKIHTVDPLDYYTDELKQLALSKYIRTAPPVSGKIDYDIDGKLIGNWFQEGTNGYEGTKRQSLDGYSKTHLAVVPDHIDPSMYIASFGNFGGKFKQLIIASASPDPKEVSVATGLVKYDLASFDYIKEDGTFWNGMSFARNLALRENKRETGCVLYQLVDTRRLRVQTFPNVSCTGISGFQSQGTIYTR